MSAPPAARPRRGDTADSGLRGWLADCAARNRMTTTLLPLDELPQWGTDPDSGDLRHASGRFFRITGLAVERDDGPVRSWSQPIIDQPEIGILGLLASRVDGSLRFLMQAKVEPGNCNGLQLSPTVQATHSNYTRVHGGLAVPYLDFFRTRGRGRVLVDVLQSEQGAWFYQKRNRNMIVLLDDPADAEPLPDFRWIGLEDLYSLLHETDLVNMDTRTVLSCLPLHRIGGSLPPDGTVDGRLAAAVRRSLDRDAPARTPWPDLLSWVTDSRCRGGVRSRPVPLREVDPAWRRTPERIAHDSGRFFSIVGLGVRASGREVREWAQPMLRPHGEGLAAFFVSELDGVLHVLVRIAPAPGFRDGVELAPTVQCTPDNYGPDGRPAYLDELLAAPADRHRFDTVLSEEGGRFDRARTRYLVHEVDPGEHRDPPPDCRWVTLAQLGDLLQHSNYVDVEARTLVAAVHSLAIPAGDG